MSRLCSDSRLQSYTIDVVAYLYYIQGAIKKVSAWPISVPNKIKIVFASYSSRTEHDMHNMTFGL